MKYIALTAKGEFLILSEVSEFSRKPTALTPTKDVHSASVLMKTEWREGLKGLKDTRQSDLVVQYLPAEVKRTVTIHPPEVGS